MDTLKQQGQDLIQNMSSNGLTMTDSDFNSQVDQLGSLYGKVGGKGDFSQIGDALKNARAQRLQNPKTDWATSVGRGIASPFSQIASTASTAMMQGAGWLSDKAGSVLDNLGLSGKISSSLHSFSDTAQEGVNNAEQYGVDLGALGRVKPIGSDQAMALRNGTMGEGEALGKAVLDAVGTGAQLASYGLGGEMGTAAKAAIGTAAVYSGGTAAKDVAAGKDANTTISDAALTFLGGAAGGILLHGIGSALGAVGSSVAKTAVGKAILGSMDGVINDVKGVAQETGNNPTMLQNVYNAGVDKLKSLKMGLLGMYQDALVKPEVDMLDATQKDVSQARTLVESKKGAAFQKVFNNDTKIVPEDVVPQTQDLIQSHGEQVGIFGPDSTLSSADKKAINDRMMALPTEQANAQGRFQTWLSGLQNTLSKPEITTKALDPYIMTGRPSFGGTGEYDKYGSQILASLRDEFGSYLSTEKPALSAAFKDGMATKNQIDTQYKTGLMSAPYEAPNQQEMMRQIASGEIKGTDPQVNTLIDSMSPDVKQNFKNGLVNSVRADAWNTMKAGGFSQDAYNQAAKQIDKFVSSFSGTKALDPTDALRLSEWSSLMQHDFENNPDFQSSLTGVTGPTTQGTTLSGTNSDVGAKLADMTIQGQNVKAMEPVITKIKEGNLSEVPATFSKLSDEEKTAVFSQLAPEQQQYLGQAVLSSKLGSLADIDPSTKVADLSGVYKALKGVMDDKVLFDKGFSPEQQTAIDKLVTYIGTVKDIKSVNMTKTLSKMVGGAMLGAFGHPMWGMGMAGHAATDMISTFLSNEKEDPAEMAALFKKAQEYTGEKDPASANVLKWVGDLFKSKLGATAATEASGQGINSGLNSSKVSKGKI